MHILGTRETSLPSEVAPDVRSRSYLIEADAHVVADCEGVLIAHGDATTGYSLYLRSGHLVHDMNVGGEHVLVRSAEPVPPGRHRLGVRVRRLTREAQPIERTGPETGPRVSEWVSEFTLLIDGIPSGRISSRLGLHNFVSWTGLDIGRDRGSPVSDYASPFAFTGKLVKVTVTMDDDQRLDAAGVGAAQMAHD
jgi:arylsulfatase